MSSRGTITARHPAGRYTPESIDVKYDGKRFDGDSRIGKMIPLSAFNPGPGRRFWLLSEWIDKFSLVAFNAPNLDDSV